MVFTEEEVFETIELKQEYLLYFIKIADKFHIASDTAIAANHHR
jgi:hypothetical protein